MGTDKTLPGIGNPLPPTLERPAVDWPGPNEAALQLRGDIAYEVRQKAPHIVDPFGRVRLMHEGLVRRHLGLPPLPSSTLRGLPDLSKDLHVKFTPSPPPPASATSAPRNEARLCLDAKAAATVRAAGFGHLLAPDGSCPLSAEGRVSAILRQAKTAVQHPIVRANVAAASRAGAGAVGYLRARPGSVALGALLLGIGLGVLWWWLGRRGLGARVVQAALRYGSTAEGDVGFAEMMGGVGGEGYRYYSTNPRRGTTCAIVTNAVLAKAGVPEQLLNRGPAFRPGDHASALKSLAQKHGAWIENPSLRELRPGDCYYLKAAPGGAWHIGIVLSVDGGTLETYDGGQNAKPRAHGEKYPPQAARRVTRKAELREGIWWVSGPDGSAPFRPLSGRVNIERLGRGLGL